MPPLAVMDTNAWLDWLVFDDPGIAAIRSAVIDGSLILLASAWMRDELLSVLSRPIILARDAGAPEQIREFDRWTRRCDPATTGPLRCTDPADQAFIDLACQHRARWLITKDRALLRLARAARARYGLAILPPALVELPKPSCDSPSPSS